MSGTVSFEPPEEFRKKPSLGRVEPIPNTQWVQILVQLVDFTLVNFRDRHRAEWTTDVSD
jgi:hypothetical protein